MATRSDAKLVQQTLPFWKQQVAFGKMLHSIRDNFPIHSQPAFNYLIAHATGYTLTSLLDSLVQAVHVGLAPLYRELNQKALTHRSRRGTHYEGEFESINTLMAARNVLLAHRVANDHLAAPLLEDLHRKYPVEWMLVDAVLTDIERLTEDWQDSGIFDSEATMEDGAPDSLPPVGDFVALLETLAGTPMPDKMLFEFPPEPVTSILI
jgi:hypothetical protein